MIGGLVFFYHCDSAELVLVLGGGRERESVFDGFGFGFGDLLVFVDWHLEWLVWFWGGNQQGLGFLFAGPNQRFFGWFWVWEFGFFLVWGGFEALSLRLDEGWGCYFLLKVLVSD